MEGDEFTLSLFVLISYLGLAWWAWYHAGLPELHNRKKGTLNEMHG